MGCEGRLMYKGFCFNDIFLFHDYMSCLFCVKFHISEQYNDIFIRPHSLFYIHDYKTFAGDMLVSVDTQRGSVLAACRPSNAVTTWARCDASVGDILMT